MASDLSPELSLFPRNFRHRMKMMRMLRTVLTVEMVMVMTRVVCELSPSLSTSPLWSCMRK